MNQRNTVLTGIPRSGTSLVCYLLNQLPDVLALVEPMDVSGFPNLAGPQAWREDIADFCTEQRRTLAQAGTVVTRTAGDGRDDNTFSDQKAADGLRRSIIRRTSIKVDRPLSENFLLVIKHPNAFTAILEHLVDHFPCYAIIRHPLAVLASWNTVNLRLREGHAPAAEMLDSRLKARLAQHEDPYDRQLLLLSWYYERYQECLPAERILRYEDIIASRGKALGIITPKAATLNEPLESRNRNSLYDREFMNLLRERLQKSEGAYWDSYPRNLDSAEGQGPASLARRILGYLRSLPGAGS